MAGSDGNWRLHADFALGEYDSARHHARTIASECQKMTRLVRESSGWRVLVQSPAILEDDFENSAAAGHEYEEDEYTLNCDGNDWVEPSDKDDEARQDILDEIYDMQDEWSNNRDDGWPY